MRQSIWQLTVLRSVRPRPAALSSSSSLGRLRSGLLLPAAAVEEIWQLTVQEVCGRGRRPYPISARHTPSLSSQPKYSKQREHLTSQD